MTDPYSAAAQAYASGARSILAPTGAPTGERGSSEPLSRSGAELAERAEALYPHSVELTRAAESEERLGHPDPAVRTQTAAGLLAKALTDLEIGARLYIAAADEEEDEEASAGDSRSGARAERGISQVADAELEANLRLILGETAAEGPKRGERGRRTLRDADDGRGRLAEVVGDALALISERAAKTGQSALGGLLGLGAAEIAQAAGMVGMDVARAFGLAEKVSRLYTICRSFIAQAFESLVALLGLGVAQTAAGKVVEWVGELKDGKLLDDLLARMYDTERTASYLSERIESSQADLDAYSRTIETVENLDDDYARQLGLSEKLLKGLRFIAFVPAAALPQGRLILAATYTVLAAYVILAGADYLDAERLKLLDRTPGVRQAVELGLAPSAPGL